MNTIANIECEVDKYLGNIEGASMFKINGGTIVELKELDKVIGYDLSEYDEFGELMVFDIEGVKELGFNGMISHIPDSLGCVDNTEEIINFFKASLQQ